MTTQSTNGQSHWLELGRELWKRTTGGLRHPSYVIFFVVAIVGIGAVGFWIEVYVWWFAKPAISTTSIRTAMVAFVPAFMASTSMQLIWAESHQRSLRAMSILLLVTCLVGLSVCRTLPVDNEWAIYAGIFSCVIAVWTWWIANANQADFLDDWNPAFAKGPLDVNATLAGDTSSFKTE